MTRPIIGNALLKAGTVAMLAASVITLAHADDYGRNGENHGHRKYGKKIELSKRPKTIVIDNLNTAMFTRGDHEMAEMAEHVCGMCHSVDYSTTQPKLSCEVWAKEIVKMGNTFGAHEHWEAESFTYTMLNSVLVYLADNYGDSYGSTTCDMNAVKAIPGLSE